LSKKNLRYTIKTIRCTTEGGERLRRGSGGNYGGQKKKWEGGEGKVFLQLKTQGWGRSRELVKKSIG